ncbi:MAG: hypothetical protein ACXABH_15130 [Candidatus Thorarchaeota archaeon]|jgi:hypothetical protein
MIIDSKFRKMILSLYDKLGDSDEFCKKLAKMLLEYGYRLSREDCLNLLEALGKIKAAGAGEIKVKDLDEKYFRHFDAPGDKWVKDI